MRGDEGGSWLGGKRVWRKMESHLCSCTFNLPINNAAIVKVKNTERTSCLRRATGATDSHLPPSHRDKELLGMKIIISSLTLKIKYHMKEVKLHMF